MLAFSMPPRNCQVSDKCSGIYRYGILGVLGHLQESGMEQRVARVGRNNRAQVVTIPLEFRFPAGMKQVFIRKVGDDVILSPRPSDWSAFLNSTARASEDFMAAVHDLPVQERDR
jgi:antitoxin VapB